MIAIIMFFSEDEKPDGHRDDKDGDHAYDTADGSRPGNDHRDDAQHGGSPVERSNGLLLIQTARQKLVMDMLAVGTEGILAVEDAAEKGEDGIKSGTARARKGTISVMTAWNLNRPMIETQAST